jgi:hypothetical protein
MTPALHRTSYDPVPIFTWVIGVALGTLLVTVF